MQRDKVHISLILLFRRLHPLAEVSVIIIIHIVDDDRYPAYLLLLFLDDQVCGRQKIQEDQKYHTGTPAHLFFI